MAIQAQQFLLPCNANGASTMGWMGNGMALTGDHLDLNASSTLLQQQRQPESPPQTMMTGVPPMCNQNNQQQLHQVLPMPFYPPANLGCSESLLTSMYTENYYREVDQIIRQQSDNMRSALQQQSKQQLALVTRIVNSKASALVRRKDEEMAKAKRRTLELEGCLLRMEAEIQEWQRIAKEHESAALDLTDRLEQVQQSNYYSGNNTVNFRNARADQAEGGPEASSCFSSSPAMAMPDANGSEAGEEGRKRRCKWCEHQDSCVLFLPCRHLCCCRTCAELLHSCPVCTAPKQASVEVLMV